MKDALINTGEKVVKESTIYKMLANIANIDFDFEAMGFKNEKNKNSNEQSNI